MHPQISIICVKFINNTLVMRFALHYPNNEENAHLPSHTQYKNGQMCDLNECIVLLRSVCLVTTMFAFKLFAIDFPNPDHDCVNLGCSYFFTI